MLLCIIENGKVHHATAEEIRKGLNEETLYLCDHKHASPATRQTLEKKKYTIYHRKPRPVG